MISKTIDLKKLDTLRREELIDQVCSLHGRIFRVDSQRKRAAILRGLRTGLEHKKLIAYYDDDQLVGFNLVTFTPVEIDDRTYCAIGSVSGLLPEYTGGNRTMRDAIPLMLRYKLQNPGTACFLVMCTSNPVCYNLFYRLCPETYPSPQNQSGGGLAARLIDAVMTLRGLENVSMNPSFYVNHLGAVAAEPLQRRESESLRFFEYANPNYRDGEQLGVCVPLTFSSLATGMMRNAKSRVRRALRKRTQRLVTAPTVA